jgi:glycosyltransferase involved in cell wall biosynthesis
MRKPGHPTLCRSALSVEISAKAFRVFDSETMPQFSIIITCHNQAKFIDDAVLSALCQPLAYREVIVVDDASSDDSVRLLRKYGDAIHLSKLGTNVGANRARNLGASLANGDYLVFLDGDDVLLPWALEMYRQILRKKPAAAMVSTLRWFEGDAPKPTEDEYPKEIRFVSYDSLVKKDRSNRPSASAMVIERESFEQIRGWTEDMFPMDDFDILIKLGACGTAIQVLSPPATAYRVHASNSIHDVRPFIRELHRVIKKIKAGGYASSKSHWLSTYAFMGGPVLFWAKKAYRNRMYWDGVRLAASGWSLSVAAALCRLGQLVGGRRPVESVAFQPEPEIPISDWTMAADRV